MEGLPSYISLTFLACVIATLGFIYFTVYQANESKGSAGLIVGTILSVWIFLVSTLSAQDFLLNFDARPPRLFLLLFVMVLSIILLFSFRKTRTFIHKMPITSLTYIHIIRVPVEIVLWWLFLEGLVSESMTFEGLNYDIISGISAPFAGIFLVGMRSKSRIAAIIWNILALGLLINIVSRAIMATPYFFDPLIFDKPNLAVFYFPFSLLPAFIVPVVFFCHIASLYQLIFPQKEVY